MKLERNVVQIADLPDRLRPRLQFLFGARADDCLSGIMRLCCQYDDLRRIVRRLNWDERDTVLITYADQVRRASEHPIATLRDFLCSREMQRFFRVIHLLPFYPASSDDGFSVEDYRQVDANFGGWRDIAELRESFDLMFDLVLNHASCKGDWFQSYLRGIDPYTRFFVEADPGDNFSRVVRPRTSPLLTPFATSRGMRHVWTTFSADQVDLNYREPSLLLEMIDVLLGYIRHGARIVRLDAVAFLWKESGTSCIHRPQTHMVVKILRDLTEALAPGTMLITETNVPQAENVSYWGNSDESQLIYNFSLPPLLLDALLAGDGTYFVRWLAECPAPPRGTSWLNFTASHDGIGVRPLESLVPTERVEHLAKATQVRGGLLSRRAGANGRDTPYELNITYFDALRDPDAPYGDPRHVDRFMASQALMLALRGIPAVYFHSLLGTPNDRQAALRTGRARLINRRKFTWKELMAFFRSSSIARRIWNRYCRLLSIRIQQPAFHPDAVQEVLESDNPRLVMFLRRSLSCEQTILVVANLSDQNQEIHLNRNAVVATGDEMLSGSAHGVLKGTIPLVPYQVMWLPVSAVG